MNACDTLTADTDHSAETFAADLTEAVFPVALRYGVGDGWLDLELDLWHSLSETVEKCARAPRVAGSPDDVAACRKGLLAELADVAYHTALRHGTRGSPRRSQTDLYQAFRSAIVGKVRGFRRAVA
jgi:hypothetical protein